MSEQIIHGGAADVSETDYDELLCRITADHEHPVMRYVRELPFESPVYPANMYHGFILPICTMDSQTEMGIPRRIARA